MSLPKIKAPTFSETFPHNTSKFSFRPFTSEEQKNLLIAAQGGDETELLENMVALVNTCTFDKFDFRKRSIADFEKAFLAIRSKSVGEVIEIGYRCLNETTGEDGQTKACNHRNFTEVPFIKDVVFTEAPSQIIDITETIKLKLLPVTMEDVIEKSDAEDYLALLKKVEWISEGETIFTEFSEEEFKEFYDSIPPLANDEIANYFSNQSTAVLTIKTQCRKCGTKSEIVVKGALNFFG